MKPTIYIYKNDTDLSTSTYVALKEIIEDNGFVTAEEYSPDVDLMACIGGDGTFLNFIHACDFPSCPVIGINTGHLGFFQELMPEQIAEFIRCYRNDEYTLQVIKPVKARIEKTDNSHEVLGLNEILIRGPYTNLTHFKVMMDDTPIQDFSGDGILVSTPVGSTAYNYSLGGALVAPELEALQLTPVAPMNSNAYRCFRTGIMFPSSKKVTLIPQNTRNDSHLLIAYDGLCEEHGNINRIELSQSDKEISLIRFKSYNYWAKLKNKLL